MEAIKKFVVIGPESTGKSTLCSRLAEYYETLWVPEYAREYLLKNGTNYSFEDLLTIAKRQIESEDAVCNQVFTNKVSTREVLQAATSVKPVSYSTTYIAHPTSSRLLFIDTDMYVMKVWCEYVFNKCHTWVLNRIAERNYDGYILCNPDLDWVADALREYPDKTVREKLYFYYKDLMTNQSTPWVDIKGGYDERFKKAVEFIDDRILNVS